MSPAVTALRDAGASSEDLAEIMGMLPSTVRKQLRGQLPPSPKLAPALGQLLGEAGAACVLELIPSRNGSTSPVRRELRVARVAVGSLLRYRDDPAALAATRSDVDRWQQLGDAAQRL
jgi:transcriptional regulator with XRE-family HTH domain